MAAILDAVERAVPSRALSYTGLTRSSTPVGGMSVVRAPSSLYATQNGIES
jgi:hypothetical protein